MDSWDMTLGASPDVPDDPGFETFLWYIYRKNRFTDVEFELEGKGEPVTFSAHKMILAMWSPKFEDMFYKGEKQNLVSLKGVDPQAFNDLLRFMYGCEPILDTYKYAFELYKVAKEFEVASLTNVCNTFLLNANVEVANVFDILEIAECMQNESMMNRCLNLIQTETLSVIMFYYARSDFTPSMVQVILNSPKLSLDSEEELLRWIFVWAKNRYLEQHIYSNLREVLHNFLPHLDFLALSNTEFTTICQRNEDFFSEDEALRIFMNIGIRNSRPMPTWYDPNAKRRIYTGKEAAVDVSGQQEISIHCPHDTNSVL